MGFLAAAVPALVGAGGSIASSLIGRGQTGRFASQQEALAAQQRRAAQPAIDYFTRLLQGNPTDLRAFLAPEIRSTNRAFDTASQRLINSSVARGGGLSLALGRVEGARAFSLADLFQGGRRTAAQTLFGGSGGLTSAGQILGSASSSAQFADTAASQRNQAFGGIFAQILNSLRSGGGGIPRSAFPPVPTISPAEPPWLSQLPPAI